MTVDVEDTITWNNAPNFSSSIGGGDGSEVFNFTINDDAIEGTVLARVRVNA